MVLLEKQFRSAVDLNRKLEMLQQRTFRALCNSKSRSTSLTQDLFTARSECQRRASRLRALKRWTAQVQRRNDELEESYAQLQEETNVLHKHHDVFTQNIGRLFDDTERLYNLKAFREAECGHLCADNDKLRARIDAICHTASHQARSLRLQQSQTRTLCGSLEQECLVRRQLEAALAQAATENEELWEFRNAVECGWSTRRRTEDWQSRSYADLDYY